MKALAHPICILMHLGSGCQFITVKQVVPNYFPASRRKEIKNNWEEDFTQNLRPLYDNL